MWYFIERLRAGRSLREGAGSPPAEQGFVQHRGEALGEGEARAGGGAAAARPRPEPRLCRPQQLVVGGSSGPGQERAQDPQQRRPGVGGDPRSPRPPQPSPGRGARPLGRFWPSPARLRFVLWLLGLGRPMSHVLAEPFVRCLGGGDGGGEPGLGARGAGWEAGPLGGAARGGREGRVVGAEGRLGHLSALPGLVVNVCSKQQEILGEGERKSAMRPCSCFAAGASPAHHPPALGRERGHCASAILAG